MYRIKHDALHNLSDTAAFLQTLNQLGQHPRSDVRDLFDCESELTVARAPGRLDVMGGIADYSGSLVLEMPIREAAFAAAQSSSDGFVHVTSVEPGGSGGTRELTIPVGELSSGYE